MQRVKEARETTDQSVRGFLDRLFCDKDGVEKHITSDRVELAEIRKLLRVAVNQKLVSILRGKKHPSPQRQDQETS